jgi:hypothetical protein
LDEKGDEPQIAVGPSVRTAGTNANSLEIRVPGREVDITQEARSGWFKGYTSLKVLKSAFDLSQSG